LSETSPKEPDNCTKQQENTMENSVYSFGETWYTACSLVRVIPMVQLIAFCRMTDGIYVGALPQIIIVHANCEVSRLPCVLSTITVLIVTTLVMDD
jgi:hypothetical protein